MFHRDEKSRREFNKEHDEEPSIGQVVNYKFIKPYIKSKKVLDIGCWSGQIEKLAIKDVKEIWGIDPGYEAISFAKKKVPKAHFLVGTIDKIPFKDSTFDIVLLLEVLEHIPQNTELSAFREINRVLNRGGYLLLTTPSDNLLSIFFDPAYFIFSHRHYSKEKLQDFLNKTNFEILDISTRGSFVQAIFNNVSLFAKYLLRKKIKEGKWIQKQVVKNYRP